MNAINLHAEDCALEGFRDRTPTTPEHMLSSAFGRTYPYRDGFISTVKFSGRSAWEKHQGDEIVITIRGAGFLLALCADGHVKPQSISCGIAVVVPAGTWHQIESDDGITLLTITPQPTEHYRAEGLPPC